MQDEDLRNVASPGCLSSILLDQESNQYCDYG